jgi:hypothetical protein
MNTPRTKACNFLIEMKRMFLFLFLFSVAFSIKAQSNRPVEASEIFISYGNSVIPEQIGIHKNDSFKWQITDEASAIIADESQGSFFSYVFSVPGTFYVEIISVHSDQNHVCSNHGFSGNFKVKVSPVKISFDVDSISFSAPLISDNLSNTIEISLPVNVSYYDNSISQIALEQVKIIFQGVNCNVNCSYAQPGQKLMNGKSLIHFNASGIAQKGTFVMLDFVDHNGLITTYYHTNEL